MLFYFGGIAAVSAQIFNAPVPAPNQNLGGGNTGWSAICASQAFNDYWVNFTWSPPLVNPSNEFILELSDVAGNFDNPLELDRVSDKNTSFDFYFQFSLPQDIAGEGFKMRVRSTSPAVISPASAAFPMYYLDVNTGLNIRTFGQSNFGDGTAEACEGQGLILEVYNLADAVSRTFNWYKNGVLIPEKGSSLAVLEAGTYAAELDYGTCAGSGNTLSNQIQVEIGTRLGVEIILPEKTALCSGEMLSLQANTNDPNFTYAWFKDGILLNPAAIGAFSYAIDTTDPSFTGKYQVEVSGTGICSERSQEIEITDAADFSLSRMNEGNLLLLPQKTVLLQITSEINDVSIQWYKDEQPLIGEQSETLTVANGQSGTYFARVSLGGACLGVFKDSEPTRVFTPVQINANIDYTGNYEACETTSATIRTSEIIAIGPDGEEYLVTSELIDLISWEWYREGQLYSDIVGPELSVFNSFDSGSFTIKGEIGGYIIESQSLQVQLNLGESVLIEASAPALCADAQEITIRPTQEITGVEYTWFFEGQVLDETGNEIQVSEPGTYELWVYRGECPSYSNQITLLAVNPELISVSPDTQIELLKGNSQVITATGGDGYIWLDAAGNQVGTGASFTVSNPGNYELIASINGCDISKSISVTPLESLQVPNVVSVNGDGINDVWIIPSVYSGQSKIKVVIYNALGQVVFQTYNYQNNWPTAAQTITGRSEVFYYKISDAQKTLKQGTITVIR